MEWPKIFNCEEIDEVRKELNDPVSGDLIVRNIDELLSDLSKDFERIAKRLQLLKGTPEFSLEISSLLIDTRGNRKGFNPSVMTILLQLTLRHTEIYGC